MSSCSSSGTLTGIRPDHGSRGYVLSGSGTVQMCSCGTLLLWPRYTWTDTGLGHVSEEEYELDSLHLRGLGWVPSQS